MAADPALLAELYRRLEGPLFRQCLSVLRDEDLARDAAQEVFVKLSSKLDTLKAPEAELAWALKAAERHCLNLLRGLERRAAREQREAAEPVGRSPVTNRQLGRAVLEGLSETSQALVVGKLVEDEDHASLARRHGVSTKTVQRKLQAAIDLARSRFKRRDDD